MTIDWNTLVSTGIGALIGSILTLIATLLAHWLERQKNTDDEEKLIFGYLQGIHDELETLWNNYNEKVGAHVESLQPGQPFLLYWAAFQDYFVIYTQNAHLIGRVENHDLRKQIVSAYSRAKGLMDTYRLNNEILHKYEQAILLHQETNDPVHKSQAEAYLQSLTQYSVSLKQSHMEVKIEVQALLRALLKQGVLSSKSA
jgi:hypothetical protein